ncbi:MAG: SixA phosphatase family protein, partial [Solirubrobacteraceae bacterium]
MVRHGEAEPHGARSDAERRLTARGEAQSRAAGAALAAIGASFEPLYTSPRLRALDTARLLSLALHCEPVVHQELSGGFGAREAGELLAAHESVCIVGHEPDLSMLAHDCCGAR